MADNVISGYAVRFNDITTIGNSFRERISPGAFTESLKRHDIVALIGHDTGRVLGRTSAGTLTLKQDRIGLWFSLDVDVSTPSGQEALGTVRRQDVKGCSFAGQFLAEEWDDGGDRLPLRTVTEIDIYEITLTAFPAYETTDASVRAAANAAAALRRKVEAAHRLRGSDDGARSVPGSLCHHPSDHTGAGMNRPWKAWYSTARWRKRREAQLSVEPLCRMCLGSEIVTAANTADHVVPHRGDPHLFWYGELQSLCASHHSRDKQLEEHGKTIVRFGPDGWPI